MGLRVEKNVCEAGLDCSHSRLEVERLRLEFERSRSDNEELLRRLSEIGKNNPGIFVKLSSGSFLNLSRVEAVQISTNGKDGIFGKVFFSDFHYSLTEENYNLVTSLLENSGYVVNGLLNDKDE